MAIAKRYHNVHQELIDQCKVYDSAAQKQVYRLYYKAMYNTSRRIVLDEHLAEDVMQEAFLKAFSKIDSYNNMSSFGAWLKRIVVNESINELRKRKPEFSSEDMSWNGEVIETDNGNQEWKKENLAKVKTAMTGMNSRYQTVLNLVLLEGYDHREVAEILNVSYNNTRVLYTRAKQKLRHLVDQM